MLNLPTLLRALSNSRYLEIKSFERKKKIILKKVKKEIKNDFNRVKKLFFLFTDTEEEKRNWQNLRIEENKIKKEKINTMFLGRVVGIDIEHQYVSISSGIKVDGVYKIAKKDFFFEVYPNLKSQTKEEIRFYLPFINTPLEDSVSKRFMKVKLAKICHN